MDLLPGQKLALAEVGGPEVYPFGHRFTCPLGDALGQERERENPKGSGCGNIGPQRVLTTS